MSYLDHAASSPLRPIARDAWVRATAEAGNPSATHSAGRRTRRFLEEARESIAHSLGADPSEVIFTSGGTEGANLAVMGAARAALAGMARSPRDPDGTPIVESGRTGGGGPRRTHVVVSAIEHPAVLEAARLLENDGHAVSYVPAAPTGRVDATALDAVVTDETALVSLMWVNNETGVVQPVAEAVASAHGAGALAHSDAVQAVGHMGVDFRASGLDLLSLSGHKLGAPVGTGVLLARRGVPIVPVSGGGGQERGIRSGTVDVAGAVALAAALREAIQLREAEATRLVALRDALAAALIAIDGARVTGSGLPAEQRAPGIVHAVLDGVRSEDLLFALDRAGFSVSAGSACRAGVHQPSHVILAMGGSQAEASGTLRCSLGWTTTAAEVSALVKALPGAVERARAAGAFRPRR
ncbi:MAG TPA: cysteine desulfurase family protein [Actinomycetaceae bacterium]|nr:cysteine desulfurase family protein [Actinomycetaceae bacterium]